MTMMTTTRMTAGRYQQAQVATADRGTLLMLMFEGALRFLSQAEAGLGEENVEQFSRFLGRAQAVIAELLHTLDHEAGGEIARDLERVYRFLLDHLLEANVRKSSGHVARARRILGIIAGAYREVLAGGLPAVGELRAP